MAVFRSSCQAASPTTSQWPAYDNERRSQLKAQRMVLYLELEMNEKKSSFWLNNKIEEFTYSKTEIIGSKEE